MASEAAATTPAKVNGRKRPIVVDTLGLLLVVMVTAASVQDRDGGKRVLDRLRFPDAQRRAGLGRRWLRRPVRSWAQQVLRVLVEIVRKKPGQ